uniref:Putative TetR family transcriptional regulator n=1 Tax=Rhodococcus sp. Mel TaxID=1093626 RepID=H8ZKT7_9NOCA|nr:putative TetR family transcriptional regulator [Rhodococcus sp. Mel]
MNVRYRTGNPFRVNARAMQQAGGESAWRFLEGVRPGLRVADALATVEDGDSGGVAVAAQLYALAVADAAAMATWQWNLGALLLQPEARSAELTEFQDQRRALRQHYITLSQALTLHTGIEDVGDQVLRLVVTIINQRLDDQVTDQTPRQLARSGLRICGWTGPMSDVEARADQLLDTLRARGVEVPAVPTRGRVETHRPAPR